MGSWKRFWVSPFSLKSSTFFLFSSQFQWYDWIPRQRFPLWSTLSLCYNWINLLTSKFSSLVHTLLLSFLIVRLGLSAAICKHNKRVSDGGSQPKSIWKIAVTRLDHHVLLKSFDYIAVIYLYFICFVCQDFLAKSRLRIWRFYCNFGAENVHWNI